MDVTRFRGLTPADAAAELTSRGWQQIGSGAAAFCFGKEGSDRVIKIVCGDRGQDAAVSLFQQHPDEPAFPRVYSRAELATPRCFIVEMERLQPQPEPTDYWNDTRRRIAKGAVHVGGPMDVMLGKKAADLIRQNSMEIGEGVDLHPDNLMLRKDGTVVAVGPFYCAANYFAKDKVRTSIINSKRATA